MARLDFLARPFQALVTTILLMLAFANLSLRSNAQEMLSAPAGVAELDSQDPLANALLGFHRSWKIDPSTLDQLHGPLLRRNIKVTSAQSCAASNCHGGPTPGIAQPRTQRGSEYQLWKENDPHARSWRTICGPESVAMMKRLRIMDANNQIVDQTGFDNCLGCHNTTGRFSEPRSAVRIQEGVGCNACHGPAERWINRHYQDHWSAEHARIDGFIPAGDLYTRARMCASCHVGDKDRDMNHDIIAAGHPTLQFEMATYHAWQPKHWRDHESADRTFYEAQLWLAGQIAAADAALSLLESRASGGNPISQWPELATFDCASCHHGLGLDNQRQPNLNAGATHSQWNFAGLQWLFKFRMAVGQADPSDRELQQAIENVSQQVESSVTPDPASVAEAASHARVALANWYRGRSGKQERESFRSGRLAELVAFVAQSGTAYSTWESATQLYLAAVAARESWPNGHHEDARRIVAQMRQGLAYPESIDISRMAKRGNAIGPPATREDMMQLGRALSQVLAPNEFSPREPMQPKDRDSMSFDASQLDALLREIESKWDATPRTQREPFTPVPRDTPAPQETNPNKPEPDKPKPNMPKPEDQEPQKVLQELENIFDSIKSEPNK